MESASLVLIPELKLYDFHVTAGICEPGARVIRSSHPDFISNSFHHFPVVVDALGVPWEPSSLYLLSKLKNFKLPNYKTLSSIANDLLTFKRFLDEMQMEYDVFPRRKMLRPTYRYRAYLIDKVANNELQIATATRKMASVVNFYRWLKQEGVIDAEYCTWEETEVSISFRDSFGFSGSKVVCSSDLAIKSHNHHNPKYIYDGGKLSPLSREAQEGLAVRLRDVNNIEMTLMFLIALTSGARLQSVCTIRLGDVSGERHDTKLEPIKIGRYTQVDSVTIP